MKISDWLDEKEAAKDDISQIVLPGDVQDVAIRRRGAGSESYDCKNHERGGILLNQPNNATMKATERIVKYEIKRWCEITEEFLQTVFNQLYTQPVTLWIPATKTHLLFPVRLRSAGNSETL